MIRAISVRKPLAPFSPSMTEMPIRLTGRDEDGSTDMGAGMGVGASSSKGTCCSDIALNPCLCHPSYVFRHCYSSGSFRHPSNRCASSKLSCSAFSRPNVEFSAFPNSSICCKQSHEFTKAGAQCSLGVCAYPPNSPCEPKPWFGSCVHTPKLTL